MVLEALSDEELIIRLRDGTDRAFDIIYVRYRQRLVSTAYQRLKSQSAAEELAQELMMDLWQRRNTLTLKSNFSVYIFSALRYAVLDFIRKSDRQEQYIKEMLAIAHVVVEEDMPNAAELEMLYSKLESSVEALPDKCKVVFKLRRFENKSIIEISQQLGISVDTTKYHIAAAMKILRSDFGQVPVLLLWISSNVI